MNRLKLINTFLSISLLFLIMSISASAQPNQASPAESNFEATLHVLVGSGQAGTGENLPSSLGGVSKQIRGEFGTSNLKLINTYLGRMSSQGNLEYKGVSNLYVQEPQPGAPSFLDWQLFGLRPQESGSQHVFQFQMFRFGARVPVRIGAFPDENKPAPINYESIGLKLDRISVKDNVPTLVGTLTQPKSDGTLFLILTVKNVDK